MSNGKFTGVREGYEDIAVEEAKKLMESHLRRDIINSMWRIIGRKMCEEKMREKLANVIETSIDNASKNAIRIHGFYLEEEQKKYLQETIEKTFNGTDSPARKEALAIADKMWKERVLQTHI